MKNEFLRHMLSTIDYRFAISISFGNNEFGDFYTGNGSRTPREIVHHIYQVLYRTRTFLDEKEIDHEASDMLDWANEIERFKKEIRKTNEVLANSELDLNSSKKIIQGPFSDLLTHIGQISMLSRTYGKPIKGEDFSKAKINTRIE